MYNQPTPGASVITDVGKGFRATRATDTLPQSAEENIFTVSGGRVFITRFFGEVTDTFSATDPQLSITTAPTVGTAVVLASTVDSKDMEIGGFLSVEGDGSALILSLAGAVLGTAVPCGCVVAAGSIVLKSLASQTGSMKWDLTYFPIDLGAAVVGTAV